MSRLPLIDLPDLLIEVDQWVGSSRHLRHLNGREPQRHDFLPVFYAALLSQGCNFGFARIGAWQPIVSEWATYIINAP